MPACFSAEVSGLRLDPSDVRFHFDTKITDAHLHFGAKVGDVGLGGEVFLDRLESGRRCSEVVMGLF